MIAREIKEKLSVVNKARFRVLINNSVIRNLKILNGDGVELEFYYFLFVSNALWDALCISDRTFI